MIMTVDMGGTKTLCGFWEGGRLLEKKKFATASIPDFTQLLFRLTQGRNLESLCIAAAGPVTEDRAELSNASRVLHVDALRGTLADIPHIAVINDLEALGYSLSSLEESQLSLFRKGCPAQGAKAVISIGTGLGVSAVTREGIVMPSEGGHMDFAPQDPQQQKLLSALWEEYGHVSYERLLSGQGLANLYFALTGRRTAPEQVTQSAKAGAPEAREALKLFTRILAAFCGSCALVFMAAGGIYLGGGVMPKILPLLDKDLFEEAYLCKGRLRGTLSRIPVYVILDEAAPSLGAAVYASRLSAAL